MISGKARQPCAFSFGSAFATVSFLHFYINFGISSSNKEGERGKTLGVAKKFTGQDVEDCLCNSNCLYNSNIAVYKDSISI